MTIKAVFTNEGNEDDGSSEVKTEATTNESAESNEPVTVVQGTESAESLDNSEES